MNRQACIVMGPAGSGKTTIARATSTYLGVPFADADDHHSKSAKEKMFNGIALDDADRAPWLAQLRALIEAHDARGGPLILACSALKRQYRAMLGAADPRIRFVYLDVPAAVLETRLRSRAEHFVGPGLLASQLKTLEIPDPGEALILDGTRSIGDLVESIAADLTQRDGHEAIP